MCVVLSIFEIAKIFEKVTAAARQRPPWRPCRGLASWRMLTPPMLSNATCVLKALSWFTWCEAPLLRGQSGFQRICGKYMAWYVLRFGKMLVYIRVASKNIVGVSLSVFTACMCCIVNFWSCQNFWKSDSCCKAMPTWAALPGARILTDAHPTNNFDCKKCAERAFLIYMVRSAPSARPFGLSTYRRGICGVVCFESL